MLVRIVLLHLRQIGKTTTMSMLCGLFAQTSGTAYVDGYKLDRMDDIRLRLGLCPQFDILFEDLTCMEHLLLYARLKCVPIRQEKEHVEKLLLDVGLSSKTAAMKKRNPLAGTLSGGMKRRLSIASMVNFI